jgi:hypothetical protein
MIILILPKISNSKVPAYRRQANAKSKSKAQISKNLDFEL